MAPQHLFSASLEAHMRAYKKQVKIEQANITYQAMENKIVQEGNQMQLSQADIQNKLDQMKKELIQSTINNKISITKTNAPRVKRVKEDYGAIGQLLEDFPIIPDTPGVKQQRIEEKEKIRTDTVKNIMNLYNGEPKKQRDALLNEIINVSANKAERKKLSEQQFKDEVKKNFNKIASDPKVNQTLITELQNAISQKYLKPITPNKPYEKKLSPFQQELKDFIDKKSSQATTASTSLTSPIAKNKKSDVAKATAALKAEFKKAGKPWPFSKTGNVSYSNMIHAREKLLGQGLKKNK
jgi:hypothetical protein